MYLEKIDGSDAEVLCGLVQALATSDPEGAEQYAQRLKGVPSYDHLDAEELEKAAIPKIDKNLKRGKEGAGDGKDEDAAEGETEGKAKKAKRKRKRKIRYPKNFDPQNPGPMPDPERWLPKRERAEFKKRMRKRDKALARGPQGTMPVDDTAFRKQGPSTAQIEVNSSDKTRNKPRNTPKRPTKGKK